MSIDIPSTGANIQETTPMLKTPHRPLLLPLVLATLVAAPILAGIADAGAVAADPRGDGVLTADELRAHFRRNDTLGLIDGPQWLVLLSAHTARHTEQVREVKATAGFPADS